MYAAQNRSPLLTEKNDFFISVALEDPWIFFFTAYKKKDPWIFLDWLNSKKYIFLAFTPPPNPG